MDALGDMSPRVSAASAQAEIRSLRSDLQATQDRCMIARREADRFRTTLDEVKASMLLQIEQLSQTKAQLESSHVQLKVNAERDRRLREQAEKEAADAIAEQERHASFVKEVRKQVDRKVNTLVEQLHQREEEVHKLQYAVRECAKDKDKLSALEQLLHSREGHISTLVEEVAKLKSQYSESLLEHSRQLQRTVSESPVHRLSMPPPPVNGADPHLLESSQTLQICREWVAAIEKEVQQMESTLEGHYETITDARLQAEREPTGSSSGWDVAIQAERRRLSHLKQLERERSLQQAAALAHGTTASVIKGGIGSVNFVLTRVKGLLMDICSQGNHLKSLLAARIVRVTEEPVRDHHHAPAEEGRIFILQAEREQLLNELRDSRNRASELERRLTDAATIAATSVRQAALDCEATHAQRNRDDSDRWSKERSSLRDEIEKLQQARREKELSVEDLERQLSALRRENLDNAQRSREQVDALQRQLSDGNERCLSLQSSVEQAKLKRSAAVKEVELLKAELLQAHKDLSALNKEADEAHDQFRRVSTELESARSALRFESEQRENDLIARQVTAGDVSGQTMFADWKKTHKAGVAATRVAASTAPVFVAATPDSARRVILGDAAGRPQGKPAFR
mgnify:CR=1 FL=1